MAILTLYHGTPDEVVEPTFGKGNDKHDYGRRFYLTDDINLAKEWAVCLPIGRDGYIHKFELNIEGLKILDFQKYNILYWLAELMKHRPAADSRRYQVLAHKFITKYSIDTSMCDVITGWRADASYFFIAKEFVRDNIDLDILKELLTIGNLGIQYCIKSELAYSQLHEVKEELQKVPFDLFNAKYNQRDTDARQRMHALVDSENNKVTKVFSTLLGDENDGSLPTSLFS